MKAGIGLSVAALVTVLLVSAVAMLTKERIAYSQQQLITASLLDIVPNALHDNSLVAEKFTVQHEALGSLEPQTAYPIIKNGEWQGSVISAQAPNGYGGPIRLLVGIRADHSLLGVRVVQHSETPGLGDDIERARSNWITGFNNQSLSSLPSAQWSVKKDGGAFDQFTGATITPRAVVHAVHRVLHWHSTTGQTMLQKLHRETRNAHSLSRSNNALSELSE